MRRSILWNGTRRSATSRRRRRSVAHGWFSCTSAKAVSRRPTIAAPEVSEGPRRIDGGSRHVGDGAPPPTVRQPHDSLPALSLRPPERCQLLHEGGDASPAAEGLDSP